MCIIIDANLAAYVFSSPTPQDYAPIIRWIMGSGKMVFGGENGRELQKVGKAVKQIQEWKRSGRAVEIPGVDEEQSKIIEFNICKSNDPHIIALARKSGARTLCSNDQELHGDFKNAALVPRPRGRVYQNRNHSATLMHTRGCRR